MADIGCDIAFLSKDELSHELNIRNISYKSNAKRDDLRKLLRSTCKLSRRGSIKLPSAFPSENVDEELPMLTTKVEDITSEAAKGDLSDFARSRLIGRVNYLLCRLSRFTAATEETEILKSALLQTLSELDISSDLSSESEDDRGQPPLVQLSKNKYSLTSQHDWRLVVPFEKRSEILKKYHDDSSSGHFGVAKTHKRISSIYF
ncbi:hypothetical protein ACJJTC_002712 [Scirpophaga incertulas]